MTVSGKTALLADRFRAHDTFRPEPTEPAGRRLIAWLSLDPRGWQP